MCHVLCGVPYKFNFVGPLFLLYLKRHFDYGSAICRKGRNKIVKNLVDKG